MPVSAAQRFERFFATTSDCQFYVKRDDKGKFRYVHANPAALAVTGRSEERDILGLTPIEALGEDYGTTVENNIDRAFQQGCPYHFNGPIGQSPDAPVYDAIYFPLADDSGKVVGILGSARDVSEISSLNERLRHAQKLEALGELAGSVAHDFNNVLTSMQSALRFLGRDDLTAANKELVLTEANRTLSNGAALIQRLTAFARKEKLQAVPHDMEELISASLPIVRRILGKRVALELRCDQNLWKACCDRNEFQIALMNLATNARDAIEGAGAVSIAARNGMRRPSDPKSHPPEYVEVTMIDNGGGMPEGVLKQALDPFFTTKVEGKGTGLGLSSVAKFAHDVGGAVRIESEVERGTAVSILLPRELA